MPENMPESACNALDESPLPEYPSEKARNQAEMIIDELYRTAGSEAARLLYEKQLARVRLASIRH